MAVNGSELIDQPFNTIFGPFTDLLGSGFFLIPLTFICIALYIKTREPAVVSMFMLASGSLLAGGSIFTGFGSMGLAYMLFAAAGLIGLFLSLYFMNK
jgi:hypothetical protein